MSRILYKRRGKFFNIDESLRHTHRPVTRRDFIGQGFRRGVGTVLGMSALSALSSRGFAISDEMFKGYTPPGNCDLANVSGRKIPFICFDLAGGANISGSNVLVGGPGGQEDFLSTAGYSKLGLPANMVPSVADGNTGNSDFINRQLGLAFHSDSAMLRGILTSAPSVATQQNTNGAVLPARSENDTGNNPHNPTYGIYRSGARGTLLQLTGSRASESGGNSLAPAMMVDPEVRPTKIDRASDVTGLVDVGDLSKVLTDPNDVVSVMETIKRISDLKLDKVQTGLDPTTDQALKERISCEYLKSADSYEKFSDPAELDPSLDDNIIGPIFTREEYDGDREFQKTAAVMKMVINGYAAAGTITMGGYDYHTGDRVTGELRDERAGRCIGACLEYAQAVGVPVMVYVFSDGSVASNGMLDMNLANPKGQWTGDNSSTGASFFLVYNPNGQPILNSSAGRDAFQHQQLGWMRSDASVETSNVYAFANSVDRLAETVVLNYAALHGSAAISAFDQNGAIYANNKKHGLGSALDHYIAFQPIVSGTL